MKYQKELDSITREGFIRRTCFAVFGKDLKASKPELTSLPHVQRGLLDACPRGRTGRPVRFQHESSRLEVPPFPLLHCRAHPLGALPL